MSSKGKNFRRRAEEDDDGDTEELPQPKKENTRRKPPSTKDKDKDKEKAKARAKPATGTKLLSFVEDDDGDDETFEKDDEGCGASSKKKKGSVARNGFGAFQGSAHKLTLAKDKDKDKDKEKEKEKEKAAEKGAVVSNLRPQAGEYTREKLMELQKSTAHLRGPRKKPPSVEAEAVVETVVVLKGLLKPVDDGQDRACIDQDSNGLERRLGMVGIGSRAGVEMDESDGNITCIPDAAAIAAARAKRERLRQARAAAPPDYIPLGGGDSVDFRGKLGSGKDAEDKRGGSSSDDDSGGDELHGRIAMIGGKSSGKSRGGGGVFESFDDGLVNRVATTGQQLDDDEEDEDRQWEEEQLRKAFGKRLEDVSHRVALPTPPLPPAHPVSPSLGYAQGVSTALPSAEWGFGGKSIGTMSASQQADAAMNALREAAKRMKDNHERIKVELQKTEESFTASLDNILSLEEQMSAAGEKYVHMQKLQAYISVLCDFLKSKGPLIEELEEHIQRLHEERAVAATERRQGDNIDEMAEVEAAISVLNKGGGITSAAREGFDATPQLDEFGRDVNLQKRLETKRRAEARDRRRAKAAQKRSISSSGNDSGYANRPIEGESSSDESDSEKRAFESGCHEVLHTAQQIFRDASEEFAQLESVKDRLEGWKRSYYPSYRDAYVSLSAPTIFAPYVRVELLEWDPLYHDADFNNMHWHSVLFDYGMPPNGGAVDPEDPDVDLVPKLVEKVVLPVLHHDIVHCWDWLSTRCTRNAVEAVKVVLNYVPASSDALQDLMAAVRARLAQSVAALEVPTWNAQVINSVPQASRVAAYKFGTSVRLLKNIGLWREVLAIPLLEQLALKELLCGKMLPHLRSLMHTPVDAITRTERVVAALGSVWTGLNSTGGFSPTVEPLAELVMSIGRVVEKRREVGVAIEDATRLARRLKRMLVELNQYDKARLLSKTFQLKEAL